MRHLFKKLIVWTLCLAMAVGMLPGLARGAKAAEPDAGASAGIAWNDEKGYYEISNYAGLLEFAKIVNGESTLFPNTSGANAIITDSFDASASSSEESKWTPIGTDSNRYTGTFDGQEKEITGLTTKDSNADHVGLFGYVGKDGSVQNVGLVGGSITGKTAIGSVVGANFGTVSNCYNTGAVSGSGDDIYNVGGVVGWNVGPVSNCYNTGAVSGSGDYVCDVGGVVGWNDGLVSNCYNTGAVSGSGDDVFYVGGVAGYNPYGTVSNCYNTGAVSGSRIGSVVGYNSQGTVSNCYYNKSICQVGAINGSDDTSNKVEGLTTAQMTGENAKLFLEYFSNAVDENNKPIWIFRENSIDTYYYPHLEGFSYSKTKKDEDWPLKITTGYTAEVSTDSFFYNGKKQVPEVTIKKDGVEVNNSPYTFALEESIDAGVHFVRFTDTGNDVIGSIPYTIKKLEIEITVHNQKYLYTGQMQGPRDKLYENEEEIKEFFDIDVDRLASTDSLSYIRLEGQGKDADTYEKALVPHVVIVNGAGQDVTSNYDITYVAGNLIIEPASVTLTANSGTTVTYDGTAKTVSGYTCNVDGLTFDGVTAGVSATKAGTYEVTFAGVTLEKTTDTTGNYKVSKTENGTLTINKKPLTITADSDTKEFDGVALTKDSVTTTALAEGDKLENITLTGTQTEVGTSDNVPSSAKIVNTAGEDVTGCYDITYVNGTLTVTKPAAPKLSDDQKPAPKQDLKEDGKEQVLVLDPAKLPEGYTIEYSIDGGKTWTAVPTGTQSGEYTIEVKYTADGNHTDFFGDTLKVMIQGVYNKTESDGDWTKGSGKTYTFRIKKAFNDEVCFDNFTGVLVDGKQAKAGENYTAVKGSTVITFAADYLETLSVGEHMIRVVFKDGEILLPLKILEAVATPTPAVDATPVTGDTANPFLFVALILVSMAGASAVVMRRRKRA